MWYHYSHAELLDGPGEGPKLFKPELRAAVKTWFENICWSKTYAELAAALPPGARGSSADFFSDEMVAAIGGANLIFGRNCDGSSNAALCNKWLDRYKADHPVHTGKAKDVPILLAYGLKDASIPKDRFACVVDKLKEGRSTEQFAKVEYCVHGNAGHSGSVLLESDYVNDWIKSKGFGTPAPAANAKACPQTTWDSSVTCDSLVAND
jgi:pimeloyl-ACP methyl ester carboxylesterase